MPVSRHAIELALVRAAECEPDRIGPFDWEVGTSHGIKRCLVGHASIACGIEAHSIGQIVGSVAADDLDSIQYFNMLAKAIRLNGARMKWGEIVRELGLVPGEAPAEPAEAPQPPQEAVPELVEV